MYFKNFIWRITGKKTTDDLEWHDMMVLGCHFKPPGLCCSGAARSRAEPSSVHGWTPPHKLLLAAQADPSAAASIRGGLCSSLQGPPGHFQGTLHALVPANKSSSVDEDAALNPAELRQRFITNTAPLFQKGQPARGRQEDGYRWAIYGHLLTWFMQTHPLAFIYVVNNIFPFICHNYYWASSQSCFGCLKILPSSMQILHCIYDIWKYFYFSLYFWQVIKLYFSNIVNQDEIFLKKTICSMFAGILFAWLLRVITKNC